MMAVSKCVLIQSLLDSVEERKNELKGRMYGQVEIMSRSVSVRMDKRTSLYKDLLENVADDVFGVLKEELHAAFMDGRAYECDCESSVSQDEESVLGSENENNSLSISTLEPQEATSSSQQFHHKCIYRVKFYAEDGEEYYEEISADRVEVIEVMDNDALEEHLREAQTFDNYSRLPENGQIDGDISEDDQQFRSDDEEMAVNGLSGMTNSVSRLTTTIEMNEEYDEAEITLQSNEDSSLHSSPTLPQPSSQSQNQNIIQDEEQALDLTVTVTGSDQNSSRLYQLSSSQQSHQDCNLDEVEDDDGEYNGNNSSNEVESIFESPVLRIIDEEVEESGEVMDNERNDEFDKECDPEITEDYSELSVMNGQMEDFWKNDKVGEQNDDDGNDGDYGDDADDADVEDINEDVVLIKVVERSEKRMRSEELKDEKRIMDNDDHGEGNEEYHEGQGFDLDIGQMDCYEDDVRNDEDLAMHCQVGDDDYDHGVDQLNGSHVDTVAPAQVPKNKSQARKHICEQCDKGFKLRSDLTRHKRTHTGERPYKCSKCNHTFSQLFNLKRHFKNCGKKRAHRRSLTKNIPSRQVEVVVPDNSSTDKRTICPYCGKFKEASELNRHILKHTNSEPKAPPEYKCPQCDQVFKNRFHLTHHIEIHTGERTLMCTWNGCTKAFKTVPHLNIHLSMHKKDVRLESQKRDKLPGKNVCNYCGKAFQKPFQLTIHIRKHTGEKPFKCSWKNCNKAFRSKSYLKIHSRQHRFTVQSVPDISET